ncbi:MAG: 50S ribosomal protein L32 [Alphaproteobacteria bacterium]|nr:50S ribosomal protein L32 [Alphaproteobacteria bacterium]
MRSTKGRTNNRRAHHKIIVSQLTEEGGVVRRRHKISLTDGTYKGKQYLSSVQKKIQKRLMKEQEIENKKNKSSEHTHSVPAPETK